MDAKDIKFEGSIREGFEVLMEAASGNLTAIAKAGGLDASGQLRSVEVQAVLTQAVGTALAGDTIAAAVRELAQATDRQTRALFALEAPSEEAK